MLFPRPFPDKCHLTHFVWLYPYRAPPPTPPINVRHNRLFTTIIQRTKTINQRQYTEKQPWYVNYTIATTSWQFKLFVNILQLITFFSFAYSTNKSNPKEICIQMKIDYKVKLTDADPEEAENNATTHFVLSHIIILLQNKEQLPVSTPSSVVQLCPHWKASLWPLIIHVIRELRRPSGDTDDCELCLLTRQENNVPPKYHVPLFQLVTNYSQREECNTAQWNMHSYLLQ